MAITKEVNIVVKESGMDKVNQSIQQLENAVHDTEQATKSFKTQLREANQELLKMSQKFGETSQEAVQAAKKVADLKDQMGLANDLVNQFNPDQKFRALGAATQLAGTGFQGLTAGVALLGDESEETQQKLLQVQSAMSFADAISNLSNLGDQWKLLKTSISSSTLFTKANTAATGVAAIVQKAFTGSVATTTVGFKLLRGAIVATGIGALIVAVGLVVANFDKFKKVLSNIGWLTAVGDAISDIVNSVTDFLGFTSESERVLDKQKQVAEKSLKQNESYLKKNEHKLSESRKREIELSNEHFQRIIDGEMTKEESLKILREKSNIDNQKAQEEANEKAIEAQNKANEKSIEAQNKADEKQAELVKSRFENENNFIAEQLKNEQLTIDEKRNIVLASQELSKEDRQKFLADLQTQEIEKEKEHNQKITDLNKKFDDEKAQRLADTAVKKEELDYENQVKEIEKLAQNELERQTLIEKLDAEHKVRMGIATKTDAEKVAAEQKVIDDKTAADKIQTEKNTKDALILMAESTASIFDSLEALGLKKSKAAQTIRKGIALAQIAVDTSTAISTAIPMAIKAGKEAASVAGPAAPFVGPLATVASYASSAALVFSNVAKAKQLLGSGGGGGGGNTGAGGGGGAAPQSPSFNLVQGTGRNQLAESIGQQAPVKAFVVARDMSTGQEMDRNIIKSASL